MDENERAPKSVMEAAAKAPPRIPQKQEINLSTHRYFRIPFMRANCNDPSKKLIFCNRKIRSKKIDSNRLQVNVVFGTHILTDNMLRDRWNFMLKSHQFY